MALRRFYIEKEMLQGEQLNLSGELVHHIRDVCRFEAGDQFEVLPGDGRALLVQISHLDKRSIQAAVLSARNIPAVPKPHITLALSVPKLPKVDWIIEKCVELGAVEIRPFISDFSFLRKVSELSENRMGRWRKLVQAATQQSGRGELMRIGEPTTLKELLQEFNRKEGVGGLFPYEGESQVRLPDALAVLKERNLEQIWVFVGSEGGFSQGEVQLFADYGLNPVTMGDQILRVETACLALVSIIKYELSR